MAFLHPRNASVVAETGAIVVGQRLDIEPLMPFARLARKRRWKSIDSVALVTTTESLLRKLVSFVNFSMSINIRSMAWYSMLGQTAIYIAKREAERQRASHTNLSYLLCTKNIRVDVYFGHKTYC